MTGGGWPGPSPTLDNWLSEERNQTLSRPPWGERPAVVGIDPSWVTSERGVGRTGVRLVLALTLGVG